MTEKLTMKTNLGDWQPASHCLLSWPIYSFINFLALFLCWQLFFFWGIALHLYSKLFWAIKKKTKPKLNTHTPPATININMHIVLLNLLGSFPVCWMLRAFILPFKSSSRCLADSAENPCPPLKLQGFCWPCSSTGIDIQPQGCSLISSLPPLLFPQDGLFHSFPFRLRKKSNSQTHISL